VGCHAPDLSKIDARQHANLVRRNKYMRELPEPRTKNTLARALHKHSRLIYLEVA
jgi:hypothetical protein